MYIYINVAADWKGWPPLAMCFSHSLTHIDVGSAELPPTDYII